VYGLRLTQHLVNFPISVFNNLAEYTFINNLSSSIIFHQYATKIIILPQVHTLILGRGNSCKVCPIQFSSKTPIFTKSIILKSSRATDHSACTLGKFTKFVSQPCNLLLSLPTLHNRKPQVKTWLNKRYSFSSAHFVFQFCTLFIV